MHRKEKNWMHMKEEYNRCLEGVCDRSQDSPRIYIIEGEEITNAITLVGNMKIANASNLNFFCPRHVLICGGRKHF